MLIQKVQHRPDPFLEPRRNPTLPAQIFFQVFDLHFELPVFIFKPLPLLGLLQLFFHRGDFLLKLLVFYLQLPHLLLCRRTPDHRRLQLLHLLHRHALDGPCQRLFRLYRVQIGLDLLHRFQQLHIPLQGLSLLFQGRDLLLCRYHLFLDSFKPLGRCSVLWQLHMRAATAQADDLKLVRLGDFR